MCLIQKVGAEATEAKLQIRLYHRSIETYIFFRNDRKTSGIVLLSHLRVSKYPQGRTAAKYYYQILHITQI